MYWGLEEKEGNHLAGFKFMKKNDIIATIGFLCFIIGFTSIMLTVVGVQWTFLGGIDHLPGASAILIKLTLIIVGFILVYNAKVKIRD